MTTQLNSSALRLSAWVLALSRRCTINWSAPWLAIEKTAPPITPAQIAYWEEVMRKVATSEEFRASAERAQCEAIFRDAADTRKHMEAEYEQARSVMAYLGFTKP